MMFRLLRMMGAFKDCVSKTITGIEVSLSAAAALKKPVTQTALSHKINSWGSLSNLIPRRVDKIETPVLCTEWCFLSLPPSARSMGKIQYVEPTLSFVFWNDHSTSQTHLSLPGSTYCGCFCVFGQVFSIPSAHSFRRLDITCPEKPFLRYVIHTDHSAPLRQI